MFFKDQKKTFLNFDRQYLYNGIFVIIIICSNVIPVDGQKLHLKEPLNLTKNKNSRTKVVKV